jgi:hypothetical protein
MNEIQDKTVESGAICQNVTTEHHFRLQLAIETSKRSDSFNNTTAIQTGYSATCLTRPCKWPAEMEVNRSLSYCSSTEPRSTHRLPKNSAQLHYSSPPSGVFWELLISCWSTRPMSTHRLPRLVVGQRWRGQQSMEGSTWCNCFSTPEQISFKRERKHSMKVLSEERLRTGTMQFDGFSSHIMDRFLCVLVVKPISFSLLFSFLFGTSLWQTGDGV